MSPEARSLPLFPLNTVLFPGASLPLRIFEDRYKLMLRDCLRADSVFGVVLIREGPEVGGPAVPHDTGTAAEIVQVDDLRGEQFLISCVGRQRFRIREITRHAPYLTARVETLDDEADPGVTHELLESVRTAVAAHAALSAGLGGGWVGDVATPSEPAALSYFAAATLRADPARKQTLLEEPTVSARLRSELDLLDRSAREIRREMEKDVTHRLSRN